MYDADKVLAKTKERAARAHDSDLDALVAKTDAEAATVVYERAKASVHKALEELRSVFPCRCYRKFLCWERLPVLNGKAYTLAMCMRVAVPSLFFPA